MYQPSIHIVPAERYEVIIDFSKLNGKKIVLQNLLEDGNLRSVMQFSVEIPLDSSKPDITPSTNTRLMESTLYDRFTTLRGYAENFRTFKPSPVKRVRDFRFERGDGGFQVNGNFFDINRDDADPTVGDVEVWNFQNDSGGWFHPIHIHLLHAGFGMVLIDRNGVPITANDQEWGWKETINDNRNNESVRALMQWPAVPVNPSNADTSAIRTRSFTFFQRRYVFHCHNVDHEDHDMMAQMHVLPDNP